MLFFGQLHMVPSFAGNADIMAEVTLSQLRILDDLLLLKPSRVFQEGQYETTTSAEVASDDSFHPLRQDIAEHFGGYQIGQAVTLKQQELLLNISASTVYLFFVRFEGSPSLCTRRPPERSAIGTIRRFRSAWPRTCHWIRRWYSRSAIRSP